jgi:hypothetical protein
MQSACRRRRHPFLGGGLLSVKPIARGLKMANDARARPAVWAGELDVSFSQEILQPVARNVFQAIDVAGGQKARRLSAALPCG